MSRRVLQCGWLPGLGENSMATGGGAASSRSDSAVTFEQVAESIMQRWSAQRDVWVRASEVEQARAYLRKVGIMTTKLPDGRFIVEGESSRAVEAPRLVAFGMQHLHGSRLTPRR
jgi:hypothetical protein